MGVFHEQGQRNIWWWDTPGLQHSCMQACMRACVRACLRACVHACMHAYIHTSMKTKGKVANKEQSRSYGTPPQTNWSIYPVYS